MTPEEFIAKWHAVELKERSASQSHFNDLCRLLGLPDPITADPKGEWFAFEHGVSKASGGEGWADVWPKAENLGDTSQAALLCASTSRAIR